MQQSAAEQMPEPCGDVGHFYFIQTDSERVPGRYRVGFTTDLAATLQSIQPSGPAYLLRVWGCVDTHVDMAKKYITANSEKMSDAAFFATHPEDQVLGEIDHDRNDMLGAVGRAERFFSVLLNCDGELEEIGSIAPDIVEEANAQAA